MSNTVRISDAQLREKIARYRQHIATFGSTEPHGVRYATEQLLSVYEELYERRQTAYTPELIDSAINALKLAQQHIEAHRA